MFGAPKGLTVHRRPASKRKFSYAGAASTIQRFVRRKVLPFARTQRGSPGSLGSTPLIRTASSFTQLMTQRTREGKEFQDGPNTLSKCHFGYYKPYIPESVLKTLQRQVKVINSAGSFESTVGTQNATWLSAADAASLYAMLPSVNDKMILHTVRGEISLVNSSSTNSTVVLYDIVAKRDSNTGNTGSPNGAWQVGIDDAGGNSTDWKVIGSIPQESVLFNEYYKIVQRTRISLAPGQMHRHEFSYTPNKVLSGEYLNNVTYGAAGITIGTMVLQYGMPAHDSTTTTAVTVDVGAIDYLFKVSYDWRELENSVTAWTKSNTLATSFAVGEQFVNQAVGQVQDATGLRPTVLHT